MRTLFAFLALVATADGAVHQLMTKEPGGIKGFATAVSVGRTDDDSYLFLTSGHCFRRTRNAQVGINKEWYTVQVISVSCDHAAGADIAVFKVSYRGYIKPTEMAAREPSVGDKLSGYGFARGGPCKTLTGRMTSRGVGSNVFINGPTYITGMSGGGVYTADGKLAAIVSGSQSEGNRAHLVVGKTFRYSQFCFGNT